MVEKKVSHWDTAIRELTAKALFKLTAREPTYMANEVLPNLFKKTTSIDVNLRHGSVLAIGEIVASLNVLESADSTPGKYIDSGLTKKLNGLVISFQDKNQFKGKIVLSFYQNFYF